MVVDILDLSFLFGFILVSFQFGHLDVQLLLFDLK